MEEDEKQAFVAGSGGGSAVYDTFSASLRTGVDVLGADADLHHYWHQSSGSFAGIL
jgi:hypothetical protein